MQCVVVALPGLTGSRENLEMNPENLVLQTGSYKIPRYRSETYSRANQ